MKIKQINETTGEEEEVEVFSQQEMDKKLSDVKSEFEGKLNIAEEEKKDLQAKITGVKEDHPNFKALKDALADKSKEIDTFRSSYETDKKQTKTDYEEGIIKSVAKGNDELQKKIKYHLENTVPGMKDDSKETHQSKIQAAIKLASDNSSDSNIFDGGMGGGGRGMDDKGGASGDKAEFSTKEVALGNKLGITEEDRKKYGSKVSKR